MFVRVVNWATILSLALVVAFAALLQWSEYAVSLHQPSPERELLRSLSLVPIAAIGFFVLAGVAWAVGWRFSRTCAEHAERSDLGITFYFFGAYIALIVGCVLREAWSLSGLAVGGFMLAYYSLFGLMCWLMYRWQSRSKPPSSLGNYIAGTEPWTYAWLIYGTLATPGVLALGYLNFQLRLQPWLALLACAVYLVALRYALLLIHWQLNCPKLGEEDMYP